MKKIIYIFSISFFFAKLNFADPEARGELIIKYLYGTTVRTFNLAISLIQSLNPTGSGF